MYIVLFLHTCTCNCKQSGRLLLILKRITFRYITFPIFYQLTVNGARGRTGADVTSPAPMELVFAHVRVQIPFQPMVASIVQDLTLEAWDVR